MAERVVVKQEFFAVGMALHRKHDRKKIARDFVTIFLEGMQK